MGVYLIRIVILGYLFLMVIAPVFAETEADELTPHTDIEQAVEEFVYDELPDQEVEVTVRSVDQRLRLHRCERPLEAFWSPGARQQGNTSVGVECKDEKPWKLYVRVAIKIMREVAVAARPLVRGDRLQKSDVEFVKKDVSRLRGSYLDDVSALEGYEVRQSVPVGAPLYTRMFRAPKLVRRGEKVTMLASIGGLEVRISGEALSDGARGDMIRVRNVSSRRVVQGEVVSKGLVRVPM